MLNPTADAHRAESELATVRLWFPTQDGVAVINPETLKINSQPPPVVIESIKIDNIVSSDFVLGISDPGSDKETTANPNRKSKLNRNSKISR